jgi:hypothetical protein
MASDQPMASRLRRLDRTTRLLLLMVIALLIGNLTFRGFCQEPGGRALAACLESQAVITHLDERLFESPYSSMASVKATLKLRGSFDIYESCPFISIVVHDVSRNGSWWKIADQVPVFGSANFEPSPRARGLWFAAVDLSDILRGGTVQLHAVAADSSRAFPPGKWSRQAPTTRLGPVLQIRREE